MFILKSEIQIGAFSFDFVTDLKVSTSWETLTNTAQLTLPKRLQLDGKPIVNGAGALFKTGDRVSVRCGYEGFPMRTLIQGHVASIKPQLPLVLEIEDAMWLFKRKALTRTFASVSLKELIAYVVSEVSPATKTSIAADIDLGRFRINKATGAQVFEELRSTYGINTFFRDNVLYSGLVYSNTFADPNFRNTVELEFERNIIDDDCDFINADDRLIKLEMVSIMPDNTKITFQTGDPDGQTRTMHYFNKPLSTLRQIAESELAKVKKTGLEGRLTTFGEPFVRFGDAVTLTDPRLPEKNGTYLVKEVEYSFGMDGYRQQIRLDQKV